MVSHLVRLGLADAGATDDSDIVVFGCPITLYGHFGPKKPGSMVIWGKTCSEKINGLCPEELVTATCLTGCDYIPRLQGMSLNKAIDTVMAWRGKVVFVCSCMLLTLFYSCMLLI